MAAGRPAPLAALAGRLLLLRAGATRTSSGGRPGAGAAAAARFASSASADAALLETAALPAAAPPAPSAAPAAAPAPAIPPEDPAEVIGRVQSFESFSAVDGPGIRAVAFLQGCAMRCVFCSNPDTWSAHAGTPTSSKEIAAHLRRLRPFLAPGGGGLTCSGGEPLLQPAFVAALFQEARRLGLTTVLDTTGQGTKRHNWDPVLPHTDLVLFCVKSLDPRKYALLTGLKQAGALRFAEELVSRGRPFWVRYVLIPGWTDSEADIAALGAWARDLYERSGGGQAGGGGSGSGGSGGSGESAREAPTLPSSSPLAPPNPPPSPVLQGVELLPYHVLGRSKWQALGLKYPLEGVATPKPAAVLPIVRRLRGEFGVPVLCSVDESGAAAAAADDPSGGGGSSALAVDRDDAAHARHIGARPA